MLNTQPLSHERIQQWIQEVAEALETGWEWNEDPEEEEEDLQGGVVQIA
jgi:hypothetical protein